MNFIIYHSGYEAGKTEGPYDPANGTRGVDTLIKSVEVNGIDRNANVYAELGSTSCAVQQLPRTFSASSSSTSARITCCGARTHFGTARLRPDPGLPKLSNRFTAVRTCLPRSSS